MGKFHKAPNIVNSECMLRHVVHRVSCCFKCLFLYAPFCLATFKLCPVSLFATFFSYKISSIYI